MKKVFALILALTMLCSVAFAADTDIAILVPNADHGWTGAVMTYAEEKAAAVNEEGTYTAQVITSSDPANQITQVEDIIENQSANTVVILPQDNTLEVTMRRLADSGIPFVMFDRVIDSVSEQAVASVKGDNRASAPRPPSASSKTAWCPATRSSSSPATTPPCRRCATTASSACCWRTAGRRSRSTPSK